MYIVNILRTFALISLIPCIIALNKMVCKQGSETFSAKTIPDETFSKFRVIEDQGMDERKINDIIGKSILDVHTSRESFTNSDHSVYSRGNKQ